MNRAHTIYRCLAVVVACTYCAFRVEMFDDEYRDNHPQFPDRISFTTSSLNWETFDKDNAPEALSVDPQIPIVLICYYEPQLQQAAPAHPIFHPIRDKSPPSSLRSSQT